MRNITESERGFALITVLWALAIISLIASAMLLSNRQSARSAALALERLQITAMTDIVLTRTVLGLLDHRIEARFRVDGVPQNIDINGQTVEVRIQDEYGKIDLNAAPEEVFVRLFVAEGLDPDAAAALADKILDWREPGDIKRLNGAKAADYRAAGLSVIPRGAGFSTVKETLLVMGITSELFNKISPALTVYSGRPSFNQQTAPLAALISLPEYDAGKALDFIASRDQEGANNAALGPIRQGKIDPAIPTAGWPFSVHATIPFGEKMIEIDAVIRLSGNPQQPFWVQWFEQKIHRKNA